MYIAVVALTMLVLPLVSIAIDSGFHPGAGAAVLVGRWFVFLGSRRSPWPRGNAPVVPAILYGKGDLSHHQ
jgi:hypothetical protein